MVARPFLLIIITTLVVSTAPEDIRQRDNLYFAEQYAHRAEANPLLEEWVGPYGGIPPFDVVRVEHFAPALEAVMNERIEVTKKIASNSAEPDFENTIAALERSGKAMDRIQKIYNIWSANMIGPEFEAVQREMELKLIVFPERIMQNEMLFRRIEAIYQSSQKSKLTPEQQRLVSLYYTNFVRSGAKLNGEQRNRLSQVNQDLTALFRKFSENVQADEQRQMLVLENENALAGLPSSVRNVLAEQARKRNLPGKWVVVNTRSSVDQFLTYSEKRALREKAWKMFISRGGKGGENDNHPVIADILKLRAERARLLGYPTHAHWMMENSMAKTPENALQLLEAAWKPALAGFQREVADMQAVARKEGIRANIAPWDYRYFAEKVKKDRYYLDPAEVKPYLQFDKLREAMFWIAGEIFNFSFSPAVDVPVYHPDVEVWEIKDKTSGKHIGLWYYDPFSREGKRPGGRISIYRVQENMDKSVTAITANSTTFSKGNEGEPVLLSWEDVMTIYHEFGHALHALTSEVTYPSLSGILVPRDYLEFPPHLMQHWLTTPEVLQRFALHYKTGEPIPDALVDRIQKASTFHQGLATTEYLVNAWMDMKYHLSPANDIASGQFERETMASLGVPKEISMHFRSVNLSILFSSDTYAGGYYSTLWSAALIADAYGAFTDVGDPYDKTVAARLRRHIFSVGNTVDPAEGYRAYRGRDLRVDALMRKRGFDSDAGR